MSIDEIMDVIEENDFDVTLTGGDPLYIGRGLLPLIERIKALGKSIWLYTGFTFEQAMADERMADVVKAVDVVVDGPFILGLRDTSLIFRGSSNQRVVDVAASLRTSTVVTIDVDSEASIL